MSPSTKGPHRIADHRRRAGHSEISRVSGPVRGSILLIHSSEMKNFDDLFAEYMRNGGLLDAVRKHHPVALLLESTRPRGLLYRHRSRWTARTRRFRRR